MLLLRVLVTAALAADITIIASHITFTTVKPAATLVGTMKDLVAALVKDLVAALVKDLVAALVKGTTLNLWTSF